MTREWLTPMERHQLHGEWADTLRSRHRGWRHPDIPIYLCEKHAVDRSAPPAEVAEGYTCWPCFWYSLEEVERKNETWRLPMFETWHGEPTSTVRQYVYIWPNGEFAYVSPSYLVPGPGTLEAVPVLLALLTEVPLDPTFENYGNFAWQDGIGALSHEPLHPAGTWTFFGNFWQYSGGFSLVTNRPDIYDPLLSGIRLNQLTAAYAAAKAELREREQKRRKQ